MVEDVVFEEIKQIRYAQESMESSLELILRGQKSQVLAELLPVFGRSRRRARVYLALNGQRNVKAIVELLGVQQPDVSAEIGELKLAGLVEQSVVAERGTVYRTKKKIDRAIGLSTWLMKNFKLDEDGQPLEKKVETPTSNDQTPASTPSEPANSGVPQTPPIGSP